MPLETMGLFERNMNMDLLHLKGMGTTSMMKSASCEDTETIRTSCHVYNGRTWLTSKVTGYHGHLGGDGQTGRHRLRQWGRRTQREDELEVERHFEVSS